MPKSDHKRTSSKHKIDRRLGVNLWGRPKSPLNDREYAPGQHGQRRKKPTDYGVQLMAKQKLKKSTELSNVGDREYFYKQLDDLLTKSGFFYSSEMAPVVKRNIRSLFNRASLTHQDLRTLHGIIRSLSGTSNRT